MALRKKTPHVVLTFASTTDAMAFEQAARDHGIPGRTIPVPSAVSAGCGLAWCAKESDRARLLDALGEHRLAIEGEHMVDLY